MKDLVTFKNHQIEALQKDNEELRKKITQLETYIYELTDKDVLEDYKTVIRNQIFR